MKSNRGESASVATGIPSALPYTQIGVGAAVVFWLFDSTLHFSAYGEPTFELLPRDINELWMRAVIASLLVAFGGYARFAEGRYRTVREELERSRRRHGLREAGRLDGFMVVCANCRAVRTTEGRWEALETVVEEATSVRFSHGFCAECSALLYGDDCDE